MTDYTGFGFATFLVLALLYFFPTLVAWHKRDRAAIFALNLFLGWTFIGWVLSLVWAMKTDRAEVR